MGFDDGELKEFSWQELQEMQAESGILTLDGSRDVGLIDNCDTNRAAAGFTTVKGYPQDKVVGVLVGRSGWTAVGADVYAAHYICLDKFPDERVSRRTSGGQSQQDRLGMHSFCYGDHVSYTQLQDGESLEDMVVFAIVHKSKTARDQARKFLILFEGSSETFFLHSCNCWQRVPRDPDTELDPDHPAFDARGVSDEERDGMEEAWAKSSKLASLMKISDAINASKASPPSLVHSRREREKKEKADKLAEKRRLKKEAEVAAAMAARKKKKAEEKRRATEEPPEEAEEAEEAEEVEKLPPAPPKPRRGEVAEKERELEAIEKKLEEKRLKMEMRFAAEQRVLAAAMEKQKAESEELLRKMRAEMASSGVGWGRGGGGPSNGGWGGGGLGGGGGDRMIVPHSPHAGRGRAEVDAETPESVHLLKRKLARLEGEQRESRHRGDVDKAVQRQGEIEEVQYDLQRKERRHNRVKSLA